jgi:hypothetical protein
MKSLIDSGKGTLYHPSNVILLQTGVAGLSEEKGEGGYICPAKMGWLLTIRGVWGSPYIQRGNSSNNIGSGP